MTTGNYIIRQILIKRGNTAATSNYTGPIGELVLDTDLKGIRVQDGITAGGTLITNGSIGYTGSQGAIGPSGPQGIQGPQGVNITFKGSVYTEADLPTTSNINEAYIVQDTGDLYVWNGTGYDNVGQIVGPTGPQGEIGPQGETGPQGLPGQDALWNFIGPYNNGNMYNEGDVVTYQGQTWYRNGINNSVIGYPPGEFTYSGDPAYWILLAEKGSDGATGPSGPQGDVGATGPIGYTGSVGIETVPNIIGVLFNNGAGEYQWSGVKLSGGGSTDTVFNEVDSILGLGGGDSQTTYQKTIDGGTSESIQDIGLAPVVFSGSYNDLEDKPILGGGGPSTDYLNFPSDLVPDVNSTRSLGTLERQWKELYVSTGSIYIGNVKLTNQNGTLQINTIERQIDPDTQEEIDVVVDTEKVQFTRTTNLELTNDPFIWDPYAAELITFTKEDYATGAEARDEIDTELALSRLNQQGLFNPYLEPDWDNTNSDGPSPAGTLWNKDGWSDLTNLNQRIYFSFYDTFLRFGNNVLTAEAVMKDVANDKYYKFDFTVWGNAGAGAPVTYTRTEIDPVNGTEIGSPVTFVKAGYDDPTQVNDPIGPGLTITRASQYSIYNLAQEPGYNNQGDPQDSPEGTVWNNEGWDDFKEVRNRSYTTFKESLNNAIGENIVGKELVMHDTINDKYWAFKFSSWTQEDMGGGFSYTRQLINTSNLFVKPDNNTETVDIFVPDDGEGSGIGITRDEYNGIYNPYREGSWDSDISPGGTLWNRDGWDDLSDLTTRIYQPFYAAFGGGGLGNKVPGSKTIMYIPETEKYYAIQWLSWTQSGGGGFSYLRYELDPAKINEGIKFADGTRIKTARGLGRVKSVASGNRRIEEATGSKTVSLTPVVSNSYTLTFYENRSNSQILAVRNPESEAIILPLYNGVVNYSRFEISLDGGNTYADGMLTGYNTGAFFLNFDDGRLVSQTTGGSFMIRVSTGGDPVVWWDKNDLPGGSADFRGAVIDYHAYTGEATFIGTIHIVDDDGDENITHTEVSSGSTDSSNDDLWVVQNEGTISYRRLDDEAKTLKVHWTAKVFYGSEYYDL